MKILLAGIAGFIGSRVAQMLAQRGDMIVGVDNINEIEIRNRLIEQFDCKLAAKSLQIIR